MPQDGADPQAPETHEEHSAHGSHRFGGDGIQFPLVHPGFCRSGSSAIGEGDGPATETHSHNFGVGFVATTIAPLDVVSDDLLIFDGYEQEHIVDGIMVFDLTDSTLHIRVSGTWLGSSVFT